VFARWLGSDLADNCARLDLGSAARQAALDGAAAPRLRDAASLDGLVDGIGRTCARLGRGGSRAHAGRLGAYLAFASVLGTAALLWSVLR
jgi:hypothetical protein